MAPDERAAKGVFLAFQYPLEIPGVATITFLRTALNAQRTASAARRSCRRRICSRRSARSPGSSASTRKCCAAPLNVGFSGGEKKRNETLQMALLEPLLCVLDETDSGLDIDALKIVANGVNALRSGGARHDRDHALSAAVGLYRARCRPRAGRGPHRARPAARSSRWNSRRPDTRNIRTRRRDGHERRHPPRQDRSRTWPGRCLHDGAAAACRAAASIAAARAAAFNHFASRGLPHRAGRGLEIHRPAAADARRQAAGGAARCAAKDAGAGWPEDCWPARGLRRLVIVDGAFVAGTVRSRRA